MEHPQDNTAPLADPALQIRPVIAQSFAVMGRNSVTFLALVAAAAAPERIVYHLSGMLGDVLSTPLTMVGCLFLYVAIFTGARADLAGKRATFGDCMRQALAMPRRALPTIALTVFSVWFLLVLPGLVLATRWAVAAPVALAEGVDGRTARARSRALVQSHQPQVRTLILLLVAMALSRALTMEPLWGLPAEAVVPFLFGNWLIPLLLTAFTAAAGAVLYQELTQAQPQDTPTEHGAVTAQG